MHLGSQMRALPLEEVEEIERAMNAGATSDERKALVRRLVKARKACAEVAS